ncbi:SIR2 family protein [Methanobacterium sp.]|uniref:SIR2 family protein n=1 Tax=Methanobacterium sp. TaxID=2164 RepID=UPI003C75BD6F
MKKNGYIGSIEAYTFEKYITTLLQALAEEENNDFVSQYTLEKARVRLDGYAPNGLDGIEGPLAIEIKYSNQYYIIRREIDYLLNQLPDFNILIIAPLKSKRRLTDINHKVTIWSLNDIKGLGDRFLQVQLQFSDEFIPDLLEYVEDLPKRWALVKKSTEEAKYKEFNIYKDKYVKNIKKAHDDGNLVLFLGSGVSKPKLPSWKELIEKLIVEFLKSQGEHIKSLDIEDDEFKSIPYITLGRLIKKGFGPLFTKKLKEAIYQGYKHSIDSSSNINSIAELCISKKVHSIVTYNYDDILEYYLYTMGIGYKEIYHKLQNPSPNLLPIYHVHGYVPKRGHVTDEMGKSVVFAEEEYHLQYKESFSWQNLKQLSLLKEKTVLFIGLSMNDPNLRRLLDLAKEFSPVGTKHYVILEDHWKSKAGEVSNIFRVQEEDIFKDLKIGVIWYNFGQHSEIKRILDSIIK